MKRLTIEAVRRGSIASGTGCWLWRGAKHRGPSRQAWEAAHGPIAGNLSVLHRCDDGRCVNPDHLYLGTARQNARDYAARGRGANAPSIILRPDARQDAFLEAGARILGTKAAVVRAVLDEAMARGVEFGAVFVPDRARKTGAL